MDITFDGVEDVGSTYTYYIEGTNKKTGDIIKSEEETAEIKAGLKGYSYVISENETIDTSSISKEVMATEPHFVVSGLDITKGNYIHIVAIDEAGNISEVSTTKLKFHYKTNIEIIDRSNPEKKVAGTKVRVTEKLEDGTILSEQELISDDKGTIELEQELILDRKVIYEIDPVEVPGEYLMDLGKQIEIQVDSNGMIQAEDKEDMPRVDNIQKQVTIAFLLENKTMNIEVEKQDKDNTKLKLGNAIFQLIDTTNGKETTITTDKTGKANANITVHANGTYTYKMIEQQAPDGYHSFGEKQIQVTFDEKGEITKVEGFDQDLFLNKAEKDHIVLTANNTREELKGYQLVLEAVDAFNRDRKLQGISYQIESITQKGQSVTLQEVTNQDGQIRMTDMPGDGKITLTIKQNGEISGYVKKDTPLIVTLEKDAQTGKLSIIRSESSKELEAFSRNGEIKIILEQERKAEQNNLKVSVTHSDDQEARYAGIEFELIQPYDIGSMIQKTNEEGNVVFSDLVYPGAGEHLYIVQLKQGPKEYEIPSQILIKVTYDDKGNVTAVEEISKNLRGIGLSVTEDETTIHHQIEANIELARNQVETQKLKIIKQDTDNTNIKLAGVTFQVRVEADGYIKTTKRTTDSFGEAIFDMAKGETVKIVIKEISTLSNYVLDNIPKEIVLHQNAQGQMEIDQGQSIPSATISNGNIIATLNNTKVLSPNNSAKANISFFLTKKDIDGNLLGNVEFEMVETTTNRTYHLVTDQNGYVELPNFAVPKEGTYEFYITETKANAGNSLPDTPIILSISYQIVDGQMKTSSIIVKKGYKWIEYKRCDEYQKGNLFQLDVHMTFINAALPVEEEGGPSDYRGEMKLHKVNEAGEPLANIEFEILVEYENKTTVKMYGTTDAAGDILKNTYFPEGKTKVTIKEPTPPEGYEPRDDIEIEVERKNGVLKITKGQTYGTDILNNKQLLVNLINKKIKDPDQPEDDVLEDLIDPLSTYGIEVIKQNKYNPDLVMQGAMFNIQVENKGATRINVNRGIPNPAEVTMEDRNKVRLYELNHTGEITISVKELVAPLHHKLNEETYKAVIYRDPDTKEMTVDTQKTTKDLDVEIDHKNRKVIIRIDNEPAELLFGITKVDEQQQEIQLANAGYTIYKFNDESAADLRSIGYVRTDNTGTGIGSINTYATSSTVLYVLQEKVVPSGYEGNKPIGIYVTTDKEGNVTNAWVKEDKEEYAKGVCQITEIKENYIGLKISNKRQGPPSYTFQIQKENEYDRTTKIGGTQFKLEVKQEHGTINEAPSNSFAVNGSTNGAGIIGFNQIGTGRIEVEFQEVRAANGYKLDTTVRKVVFNREVEQIIDSQGQRFVQKLVWDEAASDAGLEVIVNNRTQEITVKITNEPQFAIGIVKTDKKNDKIRLEGAEFRMTSSIGQEVTVTTDQNGNAYIPLGKSISNQTVTYTLKEIKVPTGYLKLPEEIKVELTFNKAGLIQNYKIVKGNDNVMVGKDVIGGTYLPLFILNEQPEIPDIDDPNNPEGSKGESPYELRIIKQNIQNEKLKIHQVTFAITIEREDGRIIRAIGTTNEDGIIELKGLKGYGKTKIKIKEINAGLGYAIDPEEREITFIREKPKPGKENDTFTVVKEETTKDFTVQIDQGERRIVVTVPNELLENGLAIVKADKEDEEKTLGGAEYAIKEEASGKEYHITTGKQGAGMVSLPLKDPGTYIFRIKETVAPKGYQLDPTEMVLEVTYKEYGVIESAKIIQGEEIGKVVTVTENYMELFMTDIEKPEEETLFKPYDVKVVKVDRDDIDIKLPGAELQIDINNSIGQTAISKTGITDQEGKVEVKKIYGTGEITIDITEIVAPPGRKFDSKTKQVKIVRNTQTGTMRLDESINVDTIIDNTKREITILVRNEQEDGLYTLELMKKDKNNQNVRLANTEFSIQIPGEKTVRKITTNEKGKAILTDLTMPVDGTYSYPIKEIKAPTGYQLIKQDINLQLTFKEGVITKAEITKGQKVAQIGEQKEQFVVVEVLDEKEESTETPYKITVKKVDGEDSTIGIAKVKFGITIEHQNGSKQYVEAYTDKEGKITIENQTDVGESIVTVQELETIEGYELDGTPRKVNYVRGASGDITILESEEPLKAEAKENEVEIIMPNEVTDEYFNLHLEKFITKQNETNIEGTEPVIKVTEQGKVSYQKPDKQITLGQHDIVEYTIRVYNDGSKAGYAEQIVDQVPKGLTFLPDNEINQQYEWRQEGERLITNYLSKEKTEDNKLEAFTLPKEPAYKDVKVVFQVNLETGAGNSLKNAAIIEKQIDEEGEEKEPGGRFEKDDEAEEEVVVQYVDIETKKYIKSIINTVGKENKVVDIIGEPSEDNVVKVEIVARDLNKTNLKVEYSIKVRNNGNKAGTVDYILDRLPAGFTFNAEENPGWKEEKGIARYEGIKGQTLKPGEEKEVRIILRWKGEATQLGQKDNYAIGVSKEDIGNKKEAKASMVISIKTGAASYMLLGLSFILIIAIGTYTIKEYVLGKNQ